jgi:hypothetical protein
MQSPTDKWLAELNAPWVRNPLESATDKWLKEFGLHQKPKEPKDKNCSNCDYCRSQEVERDEYCDCSLGFVCFLGVWDFVMRSPLENWGVGCRTWKWDLPLD